MGLNSKTSSFSLIRTNPKISGNIKLTVDSKGDLWLNSIDANKVLSGAEFKKFRVSATSSLDADLKQFIGSVPPEVVFEVRQDSNPDATSTEFTSQYELFYSMGAQPLISHLYDEAYSYLAPIWLKDDLPNYFVILRMDRPLDFPYNEDVPQGEIVTSPTTEYKVVGVGYTVSYENVNYTDGDTFTSNISNTYAIVSGTGKVVSLNENKDTNADRPAQFNEIMKKSQIIKTFDLTQNSKIGQYIRNLRNSNRFPNAPVTAKFENELLTTWNGIAYQDGILSSKGEFMDKFWSAAQTQMEFEEYVTNGFQRHGIICPMLLNLEFLFDDDTASLYSIPRYFGFYVNSIPTGSFQLDGQKLFDRKDVSGNTPAPKRANKGFRDQEESFFQNNADGVRLYYTNPRGYVPNSDLFLDENFEPRIFWLQDNKGKFYSLNQSPELLGSYNLTDTDMQVRNTAINLGDFSGLGPRILEGKGSLLDNPGRAYAVIKVNGTMFPNDKIFIYWNVGTSSDSDGPFDHVVANDLRRAFTISAGGTVVSIFGDLTPYYSLGDEIELQYGQNVITNKTLVSAATYIGGYTTFSIDQSINLTTTSGFISIIKGWGPGQSLAANSFDPIYFHPYGTPQEIASAIASAFNRIEDRTWDAINMGDEVVIRLHDGGSQQNSFFIRASLTTNDRLTIQEAAVLSSTQKFNFEGGTDTNKIRFRYDLENLERLRAADEPYIKSKIGLAKIAHIGKYVDEPVLETGGSDIGSLANWTKYGVAYIDDLLDEPLVGITSKTFTCYELFRIDVGLFSFFNVKDIDGDFFSSTYSRTPIREYHRYFDLIPGENVVVTNRTYLVKGNVATDSISYDGTVYVAGTSFVGVSGTETFSVVTGTPIVVAKIFYNKSVLTSDTLLISPTPHTYLVLGNPGDSIGYNDGSAFPPTFSAGQTFQPVATLGADANYTINSGSPIVIDLDSSELDADLKSFAGFFTLRDFLTVEEEAQDKSTILFTQRDKFFFNTIPSEYDYLKENFLKELATRSRMMPSTSKWVYSGGTDVRDNGYRLNTHPVFGTFNFSPSFTQKTQNPNAFTHEWYYLEGSPQQYPQQFKEDNYYFFPDKLDVASIKNANPSGVDYFLEYFTFQPTEDNQDQERYTIFDFNAETGICETFFRGVKILIKEVIRDTTALELRSIKPPFKQDSTRFDGYKFSCILRTHKETIGVVESPVLIRTYDNATHKTITCVIDVILDDYRTLTLLDPTNLGSTHSPEVTYSDLTDAAVDYLLLYTLKSKKVEGIYDSTASLFLTGTDSHKIGDIKLSNSIDLSSPSGAIGLFTYAYLTDNPDYDWDIRDEVQNFRRENYFYGEYTFGDTRFPYPLSTTQKQILFGIPGTTGYAQEPNPFSQYKPFVAPFSHDQFGSPVAATNISVPYGSKFEWGGFASYQKEGGNLYFTPIMQRIAFATIAQKINEYSQFVKYKTYKWDGHVTVETDNEFYLEMTTPVQIGKTEALLPQVDDDKPEEFNNVPIIGVNLTKVNASAPQFRYDGPYEPKFRNVLYFKGQKSDSIPEGGVDLSFMQATFNPRVSGFGLIQNMNYLKIARTRILDLANNKKYKSLYPLVGEIAIDRKDHFVFQSSWDPGFWRLYSNKTSFVQQAGTREMQEVKNFLGTKIMKTQDSIRIQDFTIEEVPTLDLLNMDNVTSEIAFSQNATTVSGLVNIKKRLLRYFVENGANTEFVKYLMPEFGVGDPDSIDDDVVSYLILNVLPVYETKKADPYTLKFQNNTLQLPIVRGDLSDANKLLNGYRIDKNFTITKQADFLYRFDYRKDTAQNVSITLSFDIGRI